MRERFFSNKLTPDQVTTLELVEALHWKARQRSEVVTSNQLYWELHRQGEPSSLNIQCFSEMIDRGLYGGLLDWDVQTTSHAPEFLRLQSVPTPIIECWVLSPTVVHWAINRAQDHNLTLVWSPKSYLSPHQILYTADRMLAGLEDGPAYLLCVANGLDKYAKAYETAERVLRRILEVRIARQYCNQQLGRELWTPEGLSTSVSGRTEVSEVARVAMARSRAYIDDRVQTVYLGIDPDEYRDLPSQQRTLDAFPPQDLDRLLDQEVKHIKSAG